jgi:hypothetical protein
MDTEDLRRSFRPEEIIILFVGESPPAGETFFYKADSQVFRYMFKAFLLGGLEIGRDEFLTSFKSLGCYLDDLVLKPINNTTSSERKRARKEGVVSLGARIRDLSPRHVVAIARSIRGEVNEAIARSGTRATFDCVTFPGTGRQRKFLDDMAAVLPRLLPR